MTIKVPTVAMSAVCAVCLVAATTPPSVNAAKAPAMANSVVRSYEYSLTAFNPISYLSTLTTASEAVAINVAAVQSELPLLVVFAHVNRDTDEYSAVELILETSQSVQHLVTAATALPLVSTAPEIKQVIAGIDGTGTAVAGVAQGVIATIEPYVRPFAYAFDVVITGQHAYNMVIMLPTALSTDIVTGQNPLNSITEVADALQDFVEAVTDVPDLPRINPTTGPLSESTPEEAEATEGSASTQAEESDEPAPKTQVRNSDEADKADAAAKATSADESADEAAEEATEPEQLAELDQTADSEANQEDSAEGQVGTDASGPAKKSSWRSSQEASGDKVADEPSSDKADSPSRTSTKEDKAASSDESSPKGESASSETSTARDTAKAANDRPTKDDSDSNASTSKDSDD